MTAVTYYCALDTLRRFRRLARAKAAKKAPPLRSGEYCPITGQGYCQPPSAAEVAAEEMLAALSAIDPTWHNRRTHRRPDNINAVAMARVVAIARRKIRAKSQA